MVFSGHNAEVRLRVTEPLDAKTRPTTGYQGKVEGTALRADPATADHVADRLSHRPDL